MLNQIYTTSTFIPPTLQFEIIMVIFNNLTHIQLCANPNVVEDTNIKINMYTDSLQLRDAIKLTKQKLFTRIVKYRPNKHIYSYLPFSGSRLLMGVLCGRVHTFTNKHICHWQKPKNHSQPLVGLNIYELSAATTSLPT